jgi:hypothetical protein
MVLKFIKMHLKSPLYFLEVLVVQATVTCEWKLYRADKYWDGREREAGFTASLPGW